MSHTIIDGQGSGRQVGVNDENELKVHSTALDMQNVSDVDGTAYEIEYAQSPRSEDEVERVFEVYRIE